jgi:hypothetical protein
MSSVNPPGAHDLPLLLLKPKQPAAQLGHANVVSAPSSGVSPAGSVFRARPEISVAAGAPPYSSAGFAMSTPTPFHELGRQIVDAAAKQLEAAIPGARRGVPRRLAGAQAVYVQFGDAELPQQLSVWLFAAESGSASSVPGGLDAIGVGLRHDGGQELGRGAWRFRRLLPFAWRQHIDSRFEGYRWFCAVADLPADPAAAGAEIADRVLRTLRAARAVGSP